MVNKIITFNFKYPSNIETRLVYLYTRQVQMMRYLLIAYGSGGKFCLGITFSKNIMIK